MSDCLLVCFDRSLSTTFELKFDDVRIYIDILSIKKSKNRCRDKH